MKRILCTLGAVTTTFAAVSSENLPPAAMAFQRQETHPSGSHALGEQFIFFGANPKPGEKESENPEMNLSGLKDFCVVASGRLIPADAGNPDCAKVFAPGGAPVVTTGILYANAGKPGTYRDLATFRVTNPAVTAFSVWVLDSTVKLANNFNAGLALRGNGGEPVAACATVKTDSGNEFTQFTVTGASPSDLFTVAVLSEDKGTFRHVAGLTFTAIPDPALAGKPFPVIEREGWLDLNKKGSKDVLRGSRAAGRSAPGKFAQARGHEKIQGGVGT